MNRIRWIVNNLFRLHLEAKIANTRIYIIIGLIVLTYLVLIIRIISLSTFSLRNTSIDQNKLDIADSKQKVSMLRPRKNILDRNQVVLATNALSFSVFINPTKVYNKEYAINSLLKIVPGLKRRELSNKLMSNKKFVWIARDITPAIKEKIYDLGIPSLDFQSEYRRIYTHSNSMSHILGFVGRDNIGLCGIERKMNDFLCGTGYTIDSSDTKASTKDLILSIDANIQNIVDDELSKTIKEFRAKAGAVIVADPNTGEIISMVSKPDFNPHDPSSSDVQSRFPLASLGVYELGSVFKTVLMAIAIDNSTVTTRDVYNIQPFKVSNFTISDFHKKYGWQTIPQIFMYSSNIGMSHIAIELGEKTIMKYFKRLGLLSKLNIEIGELGHPIYPKGKLSPLNLITLSYGYSLAITPLHFVQSMLPVVNGGIMMPLTLLKKQESNLDGVKQRVFNVSTSNEMLKLLRLSVTKGTGKKAEAPGYIVGGKTGTANKLHNGKYVKKNKRLASFIAVTPSHNPKYVIYMLLDEPHGNKSTFGFGTAGFTVAPTISRIISRIGILEGVAPVDEKREDIEKKLYIEYEIKK